MTDPSANLQSLSLEAFQDMIDQFGANSAHWPETQRAGAAALLDASPAARALVVEATRLDALLKRRSVKAPDRLLRSINERLDTLPVSTRCDEPLRAHS